MTRKVYRVWSVWGLNLDTNLFTSHAVALKKAEEAYKAAGQDSEIMPFEEALDTGCIMIDIWTLEE